MERNRMQSPGMGLLHFLHDSDGSRFYSRTFLFAHIVWRPSAHHCFYDFGESLTISMTRRRSWVGYSHGVSRADFACASKHRKIWAIFRGLKTRDEQGFGLPSVTAR
jgi:hypothetical protein